jgi:hypothetical protein
MVLPKAQLLALTSQFSNYIYQLNSTTPPTLGLIGIDKSWSLKKTLTSPLYAVVRQATVTSGLDPYLQNLNNFYLSNADPYCQIWSNGTDTMFVFRGSNNEYVFGYDKDTLTPCNLGGSCGQVGNLAVGLYTPIQSAVLAAAAALPSNIRITMTGHGVGGALAAYAAYNVMAVQKRTNMQLVTFGAPKVGDVTFANAVNAQARTLKASITQVCNNHATLGMDTFANYPTSSSFGHIVGSTFVGMTATQYQTEFAKVSSQWGSALYASANKDLDAFRARHSISFTAAQLSSSDMLLQNGVVTTINVTI